MAQSKIIDDGGPAFPHSWQVEDNSPDGDKINRTYSQSGISQRDWFAAQVDEEEINMHYAAAVKLVGRESPSGSYLNKDHSVEFYQWYCELTAAYRYMQADAMIAKRKNGS